MLGLLFVLAVIIIAVALLPQALRVISLRRPFLGSLELCLSLGIGLILALIAGAVKLINFL